MAKPDNIIICGGAGFIGSHLVEGFQSRGARVTVIDPCAEGTSGSAQNLAGVAATLHWIQKPVEALTAGEWDDLFSPTTLVVDAMGFTRHLEGIENPLLDLSLNYLNHLSLLPVLRRHPVPLIYLGSRGQYGNLEGSVTEDHPMRPLDPQGIHKLAAESILALYAKRYQFPCLSVRLGNCYGPRQPVQGNDIGLVGGFIRQLMADQPVAVYGDEATRARQLVFVDDVVRCVNHLSETTWSGFQPVNLAGPNILLRDLLTALTSLLGGIFSFQPFPDEIKALDCGHGELNQQRLHKLIPNFEFAELRPSLEKTCTYFKKELT